MDIKEIAEQVSKRIYVEDGLLLSKFISEKFAEALIESYKEGLLKEAGEPVLYAEFAEDGGWLGDASEYADHLEEPHALFTSDQVAAAILKATKPLEEEIDRLESESEEYAQLQSRCFDGGGSHASVFDEVSELRAQLAAAHEEIKTVTEQKNRMWFEMQTAQDQLAKAEQRVSDACALTYLEDYDLTDIAERIRSGEWRKFVKEV